LRNRIEAQLDANQGLRTIEQLRKDFAHSNVEANKAETRQRERLDRIIAKNQKNATQLSQTSNE